MHSLHNLTLGSVGPTQGAGQAPEARVQVSGEGATLALTDAKKPGRLGEDLQLKQVMKDTALAQFEMPMSSGWALSGSHKVSEEGLHC